jgi:hypothetical protein
MGLRESINQKPWLGYLAVAVLVVGGVFGYLLLTGYFDPNGPRRMSEVVTIRDAVTGDEWQMVRRKIEMELIQRSANEPLNSKVGLVNPKTGKPNGFPADGSWDGAIQRIQAKRDAASASRSNETDTPAPKGN